MPSQGKAPHFPHASFVLTYQFICDWLFCLSTISLLLHLSWSIHVLVKCLYISLLCTYWLIFRCFRACVIFSFISLTDPHMYYFLSILGTSFSLPLTQPLHVCMVGYLHPNYISVHMCSASACRSCIYVHVCALAHIICLQICFLSEAFYIVGCEVTSLYEKKNLVGQSSVHICECLWIDMSSNPFQ